LTANLQLRPVPQPSREPRGAARGPRLEPGLRASTCAVERVPGGAPIVGSSALHLPPAVCSTAWRACDPTSGVLVASLGGCGIAVASPSPRFARSGCAAVSSKTTAFAVPGRLPSTSAARRLLQPTRPASTTAAPPDPRLALRESRTSGRSRAPLDRSPHRARAAPSMPDTRPKPRALAPTVTSRGFTGQGWTSRSSTQLPNPIRSDTSRHGIVATPAGESDVASAFPVRGRRC